MTRTLFIFFSLLIISLSGISQRDTIAGWTFPTGTVDDKYANFGTSANFGTKYIGAEDTTAYPGTISRTLTWTEGLTIGDFAATSDFWSDGANAKLWSIKINGSGYKDFQVSSKQQSGNSPAGPKDFKLQFKVGSSGTWTDIPSGTVTLADNWTTGMVTNLELPDAADDPSSSIFIRWIMTSNINLTGGTVDSAAISKIDDVFITGVPVTAPVEPGDTIALWSFPTAVDTLDIYPDAGLSTNATKYISAEDTTAWPNTILRTLTFTDGASSYAGTADHWNDGANAKLWSIKIKATGYTDLKVSSKQYSDATNPGPKDWKIQARIGTDDWIDVPGGVITVANNWTMGVANLLELPSEFDNPGTQSFYIRWIMTSNLDINGNPVDSTGISKIDDVLVSGVTISGVEDILYSNRLLAYPNPATHVFNIASDREIESFSIYTLTGVMVYAGSPKSNAATINAADFANGLYLVKVTYAGTGLVETIKIQKN
jgi:hypothetical protein